MTIKNTVFFSILTGLIILVSCQRAHVSRPKSRTPVNESVNSTEYTITSIVGYWESMDDGLIVHITGFEFTPSGQGSFLDANGRLIHAGKFRDMRYLGTNQWECRQYVHSPGLVYPDDPSQIRWEYVLLEMLDKNTLKAGNTIYTRK